MTVEDAPVELPAGATILDLFDEVVRRDGGGIAFVDGDRRITFAEWAAAADGFAGELEQMGVGAGDVVCLQLPSSIDYAVAYQAAMRLGAITSGINPRLGVGEVRAIVELSQPRVVVRDTAAAAAPVPDGPWRIVERDAVTRTPTGDPFRRRHHGRSTDPVAIVWTSGTTGVPKGAVFDHECQRAVAEGGWPIAGPGDVRISPLPFAHVGTMTRVWEELSLRITTVIAPTPWTAGEALRLMEEERVTVAQGVPTQYRLLLDHPDFATRDLSALRVAGTGAARVPPELVVEMRERLGCPVTVRYSSTEAANGTGTRLDDPPEIISSTVGRPNGNIRLRLTGEEGGVVDAPGEVGTVNLWSRARMRGYWRDPERTAQAITPDGWLVTGDLGWIGDDGNLRLVGRHNEMYIRGGYNVYPGEVENVIGAHPAVAGVAVLGAAAVADERGIGEIGIAFCVPADPLAPPTLGELRRHVKDRLADYKAPDVLVLVEAIPVTSLGKPDKLALRERADQEAVAWRRVTA